MPWDKRTLALPATPPAVRMARHWVSDVLLEVGRPELVQSAQLGVSELVTNAIRHARPPVTVKVRGTVSHPRIEVTDQSLLPPRQRQPHEQPAEFLATFGRGLSLVASHSARWGSDVNVNRSGKTVWFEPSDDVRFRDVTDGLLFDLDEVLTEQAADLAKPDELITIQLLGMPPQLFAALRNHFYEMGREVRLLALSHPDRYPEAAELADALVQVEHERRQAIGIDELNTAVASGEMQIDLDYAVAPSSPATMARVRELLEVFNSRVHEDALLAARPEPVLLELQRWYLRQFIRQGAGQDPEPWRGPLTVPETPSS